MSRFLKYKSYLMNIVRYRIVRVNKFNNIRPQWVLKIQVFIITIEMIDQTNH